MKRASLAADIACGHVRPGSGGGAVTTTNVRQLLRKLVKDSAVSKADYGRYTVTATATTITRFTVDWLAFRGSLFIGSRSKGSLFIFRSSPRHLVISSQEGGGSPASLGHLRTTDSIQLKSSTVRPTSSGWRATWLGKRLLLRLGRVVSFVDDGTQTFPLRRN